MVGYTIIDANTLGKIFALAKTEEAVRIRFDQRRITIFNLVLDGTACIFLESDTWHDPSSKPPLLLQSKADNQTMATTLEVPVGPLCKVLQTITSLYQDQGVTADLDVIDPALRFTATQSNGRKIMETTIQSFHVDTEESTDISQDLRNLEYPHHIPFQIPLLLTRVPKEKKKDVGITICSDQLIFTSKDDLAENKTYYTFEAVELLGIRENWVEVLAHTVVDLFRTTLATMVDLGRRSQPQSATATMDLAEDLPIAIKCNVPGTMLQVFFSPKETGD